MDLKIIFSDKIELNELYTVLYIKFTSDGGIILKNTFEKIFPYISYTFWLWLHLHLQFLKDWYILRWRFQQQCCSARWDFHLIYIFGVVQAVSSTSPSAIQVKVVLQNWLRIRTQGPRLPPGRSKKVKNSTMNN